MKSWPTVSIVCAIATPSAVLGAQGDRAPVAAAGTYGPGLQVSRRDSGPKTAGPPSRFTGKVTVSAPFKAIAPSRLAGATVTFQPGARTAWHSHPLGQTLVVAGGTGWTQVEGGPVVVMHEGDVIVCPPGVRHWHGASLSSAMSHVAVSEAMDGQSVQWGQQVSEGDYRKGLQAEAGTSPR